MKFLSVATQTLNDDQKASLKEYDEVLELPPVLRKIWSSIPPEADLEEVGTHIDPVIDWLTVNMQDGDTVNVAGELTACLFIVLNSLFWNDVKVVTETTKQEVEEHNFPNGFARRVITRHVKWRELT